MRIALTSTKLPQIRPPPRLQVLAWSGISLNPIPSLVDAILLASSPRARPLSDDIPETYTQHDDSASTQHTPQNGRRRTAVRRVAPPSTK